MFPGDSHCYQRQVYCELSQYHAFNAIKTVQITLVATERDHPTRPGPRGHICWAPGTATAPSEDIHIPQVISMTEKAVKLVNECLPKEE
jgi:hypothetical protein